MPESPGEAASPSPIDWSLWRSFIAVVEGGSFAQAARRLGLAQPTVGRQMRSLEQQVGELLFERRPEGLRATPYALGLFERARAVEQAVVGLSESIARQAPGLAGTVRVACILTFAVELLPAILAPLLRQHPQLEVEIAASDVERNLVRRDADVSVHIARPLQPEAIVAKVAEVELGLYAHRDYVARHGRPETPADWAGHTVIGVENAEHTLRDAAAHGIQLPRGSVRLRSDTYLVQAAALRAGAGIGLCQAWLAARTPELLRLDRPGELPTLPVWVAANDDLHCNPRIRAVFDHLVAALGEHFSPPRSTG